jgi:hypothetical protein
MYTDETIYLLLCYGNYELYKFWIDHGLVLNHHILCDRESKFKCDMNVYHKFEWFDCVATSLLSTCTFAEYLNDKEMYAYGDMICECLHYCDDQIFTNIFDRYMTKRFFRCEKLYHTDKEFICLTNDQFLNICSNENKFNHVKNAYITLQLSEPIEDVKICEKLMTTKTQFIIGHSCDKYVDEWAKKYGVNISTCQHNNGHYKYTMPM